MLNGIYIDDMTVSTYFVKGVASVSAVSHEAQWETQMKKKRKDLPDMSLTSVSVSMTSHEAPRATQNDNSGGKLRKK